MSWSSGSLLMMDIMNGLIETNLTKEQRTSVYEILIDVFEEADCDTLGECLDEDDAFDIAWKLTGHIEEDDEDYEEERHYEDE